MERVYKDLTEENLTAILDNMFANIFVTDGDANVIYVNKNAIEELKTTEAELVGKNSRELIKEKIIDKSSTLEALERKAQSVGVFRNKAGEEIISISTPVFNDAGEIYMVVTYSRQQSDMDMWTSELEKEKKRTARYKNTVEYLDQIKRNSNVMIYRSDVMGELCNMAKIIAPTDSTVMIYGESGVGKEVLANYIHNYSSRSKNIFIPVNCAAIPSELMESEFFGYEKGAFTGANNKGKAGLFEVANKGTIFLDEIGELPLNMQSKLLRVLETGEFMRIGSDRTRTCDVRIISATNRDLKEMSKEKTFREDLYYRLNVLPLEIPPLRERPDDIPVLTDFYLSKVNRKYGKDISLSDDLMDRLGDYSWPGNIRELKNVVERFVITENPAIIENLIYEENRTGASAPGRPETLSEACGRRGMDTGILPLKEWTREAEKKYINQLLDQNGGNVQKVADLLQVHRSLIYRKIKNERT